MKQQTQIKLDDDHTVKIGDIFVNEWGWEQTNVDFFKVVGFTPSGKSVKIVPIESKTFEQVHDMARKVIPNPESVTGKAVTKRLGVWNNHIEAGRMIWDWDGKPCMETSYA